MCHMLQQYANLEGTPWNNGNCMLRTNRHVDLVSAFTGFPSLERALTSASSAHDSVRGHVVAQEYGGFPHWAESSSSVWLFVMALRQPARRMLSQMARQQCLAKCHRLQTLAATRECVAKRQTNAPPSQLDWILGRDRALYHMDPLDNMYTRVLSGSLSGAPLSSAQLQCANARLHRFSLFWDTNSDSGRSLPDLCLMVQESKEVPKSDDKGVEYHKPAALTNLGDLSAASLMHYPSFQADWISLFGNESAVHTVSRASWAVGSYEFSDLMRPAVLPCCPHELPPWPLLALVLAW